MDRSCVSSQRKQSLHRAKHRIRSSQDQTTTMHWPINQTASIEDSKQVCSLEDAQNQASLVGERVAGPGGTRLPGRHGPHGGIFGPPVNIRAEIMRLQATSRPVNDQNYYGKRCTPNQTDKRRKICIAHFGFSVQGKSAWPTNKFQTKSKINSRNGLNQTQSLNISIRWKAGYDKGFLANKGKKAGGAKAGRKAGNLARLKKTHNPPAALTNHALMRYRERKSSSTPVYKYKDKKSAIVVTYYPIPRLMRPQEIGWRRANFEAKSSKMRILFEVERMNQLAKMSGLPRYKLSPRDGYLLKLSNTAVKEYEHINRLVRRERALYKLSPMNGYLFKREKAFKKRGGGTRRRKPNTNVAKKKNLLSAQQKNENRQQKNESTQQKKTMRMKRKK